MFLCTPCHKESGCSQADFPMHLRSRGRCECCEEAATCLDCNGYDFRKSDHKHLPLGTP